MAAKPAVATATHPLIGLFDDADGAERAYRACVDHGYEIGRVSVVMSEGTRHGLVRSAGNVKAGLATRDAGGGELGGPKGGHTGILVTVFAAVGTAVAVPAIGFVAGPLAVAMAAAGAAGVAGGLIGAMGHWGIAADRLEGYEADIRKGVILMSVEAESAADANAIADAWRKRGGRGIQIA